MPSDPLDHFLYRMRELLDKRWANRVRYASRAAGVGWRLKLVERLEPARLIGVKRYISLPATPVGRKTHDLMPSESRYENCHLCDACGSDLPKPSDAHYVVMNRAKGHHYQSTKPVSLMDWRW